MLKPIRILQEALLGHSIRKFDLDGDAYRSSVLGRLEAANFVLSILSQIEILIWVYALFSSVRTFDSSLRIVADMGALRSTSGIILLCCMLSLLLPKTFWALSTRSRAEWFNAYIRESINVVSYEGLEAPNGILLLQFRDSEKALKISVFNSVVSFVSLISFMAVVLIALRSHL